jgi:hypothetical protein
MKTDPNEEILKRLDTIVFLLLELKDADGKMPIKEKVRLLNEAGLGYQQIARVLGKNPGNIAVHLTMLKKAGKQQDESKPEASQEVSDGKQ